MATRDPKSRLPTALVLSVASGMISVGAIAWWTATVEPEAPSEPIASRPVTVHVDRSTAERAAESFLDAWRKREHSTALALSAGEARRAVLQRQRRDAEMTDEELELKRTLWDEMATERLRLSLSSSEHLPEGRLRLTGRASGTFLGNAYERELAFVLFEQEDQGWTVEDMQLGAILSPMPQLPPGDRDPAALPMQGDDVP